MKLAASHKIAALVAALALLSGGLAWVLTRGDPLAEMSLRRDAGTVVIQRGDESIEVRDRATIEPDDVVVIDPGSVATMRLEGQRLFTLGGSKGSEIAVLGGTTVESRAGYLLAQATDRTTVMVGETRASARRALFRIDRPFGTARAGVYRGTLTLEAPGSPGAELSRLFQSTVTANQLYEEKPYHLNPGDPWDAHYLDSLVDLDRNLELYRHGYKDQLGSSLPSLGYFSSLADANVDFMRPLVKRQRPKRPGYTVDLMVGLFVAKHAPGRLDVAFERAWDLFRRGGSWAVIAGILGIERQREWQPLVAQLAGTIERSITVADGTGGETEFTLADGDDGTLGSEPPDDSFVPDTPDDDGSGQLPPEAGPRPSPPPDDDNNGNDDDNNGNGGDPSPPPCDIECQIKEIVPTPEPTSLPTGQPRK